MGQDINGVKITPFHFQTIDILVRKAMIPMMPTELASAAGSRRPLPIRLATIPQVLEALAKDNRQHIPQSRLTVSNHLGTRCTSQHHRRIHQPLVMLAHFLLSSRNSLSKMSSSASLRAVRRHFKYSLNGTPFHIGHILMNSYRIRRGVEGQLGICV